MGFKSFFLLGTQLVLHFLRALWPFGRNRGADRFLENYREDFIRPLNATESSLVPQFQRCTNCGLCGAVCPLETEPIDEISLPANRLVAADWRDLTAHRLIQKSAFSLTQCASCGECEAVCPERIPIRKLAKLVATPAT